MLASLVLFGGIVILILLAFAIIAKSRLRAEVDETVQDLAEERLIPLTVEVDQNQYFCYNSITKAFVCQGENLKEIIEKFKLRYPNKSAAIYDGDETAVRALKSQWKEHNENRSSIRHSS